MTTRMAFVIGFATMLLGSTAAPICSSAAADAVSAPSSPYIVSIGYKPVNFLSPQNPYFYVSISVKNVTAHAARFDLSFADDYVWGVWYTPLNGPKDVRLHIAPNVVPLPRKTLRQPFTMKFMDFGLYLLPGEQRKFDKSLDAYSLTLEGDYRLSLTMQLPDPSKHDATIGSDGEVFPPDTTLVTVTSNVITVRRTAKGWEQLSVTGNMATK